MGGVGSKVQFFPAFFLSFLPFSFPSFLLAFLLFLFSVKKLVIFFQPLIWICTLGGEGSKLQIIFLAKKHIYIPFLPPFFLSILLSSPPSSFLFLFSFFPPSFLPAFLLVLSSVEKLVIFFQPLIWICTFKFVLVETTNHFLSQKTHLHSFFASFLSFFPSFFPSFLLSFLLPFFPHSFLPAFLSFLFSVKKLFSSTLSKFVLLGAGGRGVGVNYRLFFQPKKHIYIPFLPPFFLSFLLSSPPSSLPPSLLPQEIITLNTIYGQIWQKSSLWMQMLGKLSL